MAADELSCYLREVAAIPRLTPDEEIKLARHLGADDPLREAYQKDLVESNLYLVVEIVERYRHTATGWLQAGGDAIELVMEGNIGLMRAADSFSADSGVSFRVHAAAIVERAIQETISRGPSRH